MPDENPKNLIDIHAAHGVFPLTQMVETGLWKALSANAKAVLGPLWNYHRQYPAACRPSRQTLAAEAGVCGPSVTKALKELEATGIVTVIFDPGPRTNTYRLQWANLKVPSLKQAKGKETKSPFPMPKTRMVPDVDYQEDGTGKLLWSKMPVKGYRMSDGCFVRSAKEQHIHDYLVSWLVPHWCNVAYADLGIRLRKSNGETDRQSTVDSVVGPRILIEQEGLAKHQRAAERYQKKLHLKVEAARMEGWEMILIPPDKRPDEWLYDLIAESWATSTIKDAENLVPMLKSADLWNPERNNKNCLRLLSHIKEAKARLSGEKASRKRTGLYEEKVNDRGIPIRVRLDLPKLCLMEKAGTEIKPESAKPKTIDDLVDELL